MFDSVVNLTACYTHKKRLMLGLPIEMISTTIPYGYTRIGNSNTLQPVEDQLRALRKAYEHSRNCSIKEVTEWLFNVTRVPLSSTGLTKIFESRLPDKIIYLPLEDRLKCFEEL